jgi:hypothetical protein
MLNEMEDGHDVWVSKDLEWVILELFEYCVDIHMEWLRRAMNTSGLYVALPRFEQALT